MIDLYRSVGYVPDGDEPIQFDFVTGIDTFVTGIDKPRKSYAIESEGDLNNVLAFLRPEDELRVRYTRLPQACRDAFTDENRDIITYKDIAAWREGLVHKEIRRPPE